MNVSLILCSRNRAEQLKATLESIRNVIIPAGCTVEVLVVDNASTDETLNVIKAAQKENPLLRTTREPRAGLSHARNTGLRETTGEVIVFTDDDVRVRPSWLAEITRKIFTGSADAVAGGVVFPDHLNTALTVPGLSSRRAWFASTEHLDPDQPATMVGANMSFHRRVLDRIPMFETELGAGGLGFGEETLFSKQLLADGFRLKGSLDTTVEHHFDIGRLRCENLLELARKMGRSHAWDFYHWELQMSRLAYVRLAQAYFRLRRATNARGGRKEQVLVSHQRLLAEEDFGFCQEYLKQSKRPQKYSGRIVVEGTLNKAHPHAKSRREAT
ncbi:MAG: glycosyltransferase family 2 protein [Opitutus sp.]